MPKSAEDMGATRSALANRIIGYLLQGPGGLTPALAAWWSNPGQSEGALELVRSYFHGVGCVWADQWLEQVTVGGSSW